MALNGERPGRSAKAIAVWTGIGAVVGVLVFVIRMIVDQNQIGANVVPYVIGGAIIGAAFAYFRGGRVPQPSGEQAPSD